MPGLFVSGAGTDIGKTYVSCLLLQQLARHGHAMRPLKPVLSGYQPDDALYSDIGRLLTAANLTVDEATISAHCPWRFTPPLAPNMAAAREGRQLDFHEITGFCDRFRAQDSRPVLIEGAGGIMSPLTDDTTNLDLARHLRLPVLMVMGSYLGGISHGLTALSVLAQAGLHVPLTVISESEGSAVDLHETREAVQRHSPYTTPIIALPRQPLDLALQHGHDMASSLLSSERL